jgi:hypothetical protein
VKEAKQRPDGVQAWSDLRLANRFDRPFKQMLEKRILTASLTHTDRDAKYRSKLLLNTHMRDSDSGIVGAKSLKLMQQRNHPLLVR